MKTTKQYRRETEAYYSTAYSQADRDRIAMNHAKELAARNAKRIELLPTIRIVFPFLNDSSSDIDAIVFAVGGTIIDIDEHDGSYTIDFPTESAARSFLMTTFPDYASADYDAIIAARDSLSF